MSQDLYSSVVTHARLALDYQHRQCSLWAFRVKFPLKFELNTETSSRNGRFFKVELNFVKWNLFWSWVSSWFGSVHPKCAQNQEETWPKVLEWASEWLYFWFLVIWKEKVRTGLFKTVLPDSGNKFHFKKLRSEFKNLQLRLVGFSRPVLVFNAEIIVFKLPKNDLGILKLYLTSKIRTR